MMISTKELCEKLGVSLSWVGKYLRSIGKQGPQLPGDKANLRTIYYDEESIVAYLNAHAIFSRQTEWLNLADYVEESKARHIPSERMKWAAISWRGSSTAPECPWAFR